MKKNLFRKVYTVSILLLVSVISLFATQYLSILPVWLFSTLTGALFNIIFGLIYIKSITFTYNPPSPTKIVLYINIAFFFLIISFFTGCGIYLLATDNLYSFLSPPVYILYIYAFIWYFHNGVSELMSFVFLDIEYKFDSLFVVRE